MTVAIVGAGATGLACAAMIGRSALVVDRIPVCGGVLGFDHDATRRLEAAARAAGVPVARLGAATGDRFVIAGLVDESLDALDKAWRSFPP